MHFCTKALHVKNIDTHKAMRFPIYQNSAFEASNSKELEEFFKGKKDGHVYSRSSNPTVSAYESAVTQISKAHGAIAFSSGMAAIANLFFSLLKARDNFIASKHLFGNTISLFDTLFKDLEVEVRYVDSIDEVASKIDAKTRFFFCETISNPQLSVIDFKALKKILKGYKIPFIADTTMTPWNIFDAKENGIDIEVLSATKWLSGGGQVLGGMVLDYGSYDWKNAFNLAPFYEKYNQNALLFKLRKETFRNLGACLTPQSAYLLNLGLETLDLRVKYSCENAYKLSKSLEKRGLKVRYPFLDSFKYSSLAKKSFEYGGALVCIEFEDKKRAYEFMDRLKIFKRGTNILDNKSLAIAPYHTIYAEFSSSQKELWEIKEGLVRLSVGLEAYEDLEADILEAL